MSKKVIIGATFEIAITFHPVGETNVEELIELVENELGAILELHTEVAKKLHVASHSLQITDKKVYPL